MSAATSIFFDLARARTCVPEPRQSMGAEETSGAQKARAKSLPFRTGWKSPAPDLHLSIEFHGVSHLRLTRIMRTMMRFVTMQLMVVKRMREVVEPAGSSASMRNRTKR